MYAKSAKRRPPSPIVAPNTQDTRPKPRIPKQSPLRPTLKAAPKITMPATAVQPTETITLQETQPTQELLSSGRQSAAIPFRQPTPYRNPYANILGALENNLDIPLTEKNSSQLTAELASRQEPTLLYKSAGQKQFTAVSYSATIFMVFAAYQNLSMYSPLANDGSWSMWLVSLTGNLGSLLFVLAGVGFATGPWKMVKSITAIPWHRAPHSKPQLKLRLEFVQIVPLIKFAPLELPVSSVLKMHSMSDKFKYLEAGRALEIRRSGVGDGFFNRVRLLVQDFKRLFDRRHYFGYLRLRNGTGLKSGTWKMDLSEAEVAYGGHALDVLLTKEWNPPAWRVAAGHTHTLRS